MSNTDIGTLYVLANRDNSLAKVGQTRNGTPDARATDYEREHGIRWHVYWYKLTCNVTYAESSAHRDLADQRFALVPGAREIFHVTPAKAVAVAERHIIPPKTEEQLAHERAESERVRKEREAAEAARAAEAVEAARVERQRQAYEEAMRAKQEAHAKAIHAFWITAFLLFFPITIAIGATGDLVDRVGPRLPALGGATVAVCIAALISGAVERIAAARSAAKPAP